MTNVVIPMAGAGSRFAKEGYTKPKPFIDVNGRTMIERVMENINLPDAHYYLIARKEHIEQEPEVVRDIESNYPVTFIPIGHLTEGAACTVLYAHSYINNDVPLLMANSDQLVDIELSDYIQDCKNRKLDGSILTFSSNHEKWSYAKTNEQGLVTEVREKVVISEHATVGIYYFSSGKLFVDSSLDMIVRNDRVNNEFYVCPVYNYAIQLHGANIGIYSIEESQMHGIGTPQDLNQYLELARV